MKNKLKSIAQKMTIVISILLTFTFVVPTHMVQADVNYGILLSPLVSLLAGIGDGIMYLLQGTMTGEWRDVYQEKDDLDELLANDEDKDGNGKGDLQEKLNYQEKDTSEATELNKDAFNGDYNIPIFKYSPEEIFNNEIAALDVNFIQPDNEKIKKMEGGEDRSSAIELRPFISSWYVGIRNLALVGLLSVLVYVGIRMLMSSASSDKAKYKQMLFDWIIAMCLLFVFHLIMSFTMIVVENLTDMIGASEATIRVRIGASGEGTAFNTNLIGLARLGLESTDASEKIAFTAVYLALVFYTAIFTFVYLKRLLYMAFLTLMAPLVTLTYPIDKISDGKAQAFDTWIKEYVFNALLQPFHLLIYTILVTSAIGFAANNMLYAIAAIGFMLPAEKLLRKMFGFEKAGTASAMGAFAGGAIAAQAISKIGSAVGGKGKSGGKGGSNMPGGKTSGNENVKTKNAGYDAFGDGAETLGGAKGAFEAENSNPEKKGKLNVSQQQGKGYQFSKGQQAKQNEKFRSKIPPKPENISKIKAFGRGLNSKLPYDLRKGDEWKRMGKNALKKAPKRLAKGARFVAKAGTAATFGALGAAAGLVTGDPSKIGQFMATGAVAGGAIGGAIANTAGNLGNKTGSFIKDTYRLGAYGAEGAALMKTMEDYKDNDVNKTFIANEMSSGLPLTGNDLNKEMDRAAEYKAYGLDDNEQIVKAMKFEDQLVAGGTNRDQARSIAAQTSTLSASEKDLKDKLSDSQKCEALRQKQARMIKAEAEKKGKSISNEQANKMSHNVINSMKRYNGIA